MNIATTIRSAIEPSPFERKWRRMSDAEKLALLRGWFAPGPYRDHMLTENPAIVEMALASEGYRCTDYPAGDYRKIGSKQVTEWSE